MLTHKELFFTRFERFWHWAQAVLIIALMVTGFEVSGTYPLLNYDVAAEWHQFFAWVLIWLWIFAIFWHFVTGEWKQYIPTTEKLLSIIYYYTKGIFEEGIRYHPFKRSRRFKHNSLQKIIYLILHIIVMPTIWITGLLYMYFSNWKQLGLETLSLAVVAELHLATAFFMLIFLIKHVYLSFVCQPITEKIKAMVTGYVEFPVENLDLYMGKIFNVLIVDEDRNFVSLIMEWILSFSTTEMNFEYSLISKNIVVSQASSLAETKEMLRSRVFDIVLLNLNLPDSNGLNTIEEISEKLQNVPIIVLINNEHILIGYQSIERGAKDFLIKNTLTQENLIQTIFSARVRHIKDMNMNY